MPFFTTADNAHFASCLADAANNIRSWETRFPRPKIAGFTKGCIIMIEDVKIYVTDFAEQFEPIRYEFDGKSTIYYDALTVNDDSDVLRMGFRERDAPGHEYMCLVTMKDQGGRRWEIASVACLYITEKNVEEGLAGATEPEDVEKHAKKKQKRTPGDSEANGIHVS